MDNSTCISTLSENFETFWYPRGRACYSKDVEDLVTFASFLGKMLCSFIKVNLGDFKQKDLTIFLALCSSNSVVLMIPLNKTNHENTCAKCLLFTPTYSKKHPSSHWHLLPLQLKCGEPFVKKCQETFLKIKGKDKKVIHGYLLPTEMNTKECYLSWIPVFPRF